LTTSAPDGSSPLRILLISSVEAIIPAPRVKRQTGRHLYTQSTTGYRQRNERQRETTLPLRWLPT